MLHCKRALQCNPFLIGDEMKLSNMTIEEKVGQMLCLAYHGTELNEQIITLVEDLKVGGLIAFARNIVSPKQIHQLNIKAQGLAKIPLFLGLDQEGGSVRRVTSGITPLAGAMGLAAGSSSEDVAKISEIVGSELRLLGFNMNFAPVADVNNNPLNPVINSRSFSDDPNKVAEYSISAAKGFQNAKVIPTIKHFPGHGDTNVDSHLGLPIVKKEIDELIEIEINPFKQAISAGVDGVMLSHVMYTALDSKYPASLSYNITTKLLKEQLGFDGLVVTDSLTMGAISKLYTKEDVLINAVNAGVDLLIFCGKADLEEQKELYNLFVELVKEGRIPLLRIDESVQKILYYKNKYNVKNVNHSWLDVSKKINEKTNLQFSERLYNQSITYIGKESFIPLKSQEKVLILFPEIKLYTLVDNENDNYQTLGSFLDFDEVIYNIETSVIEISHLAKKYDTIIMCSYNVNKDDYQHRLFNAIDKSKIIGVSLRSPYDLIHLEGLQKYFCVYEPTTMALKSLKKVITGEISPRGKLPIKL